MAFDLSWKDKVKKSEEISQNNPVISTKYILESKLRVNSGTKNNKEYAIATIPITVATGRRIYDETGAEIKDKYDSKDANITVDLAQATEPQDGYISSIPDSDGAAVVIHEKIGDKGNEAMSFDIDLATVARMAFDAKQEMYSKNDNLKDRVSTKGAQDPNRNRLSTVQNFNTTQSGVASLSANAIKDNIIQGAASACLLSNGTAKYSKETVEKVADDFAKAYGTFMGSLIPTTDKKGKTKNGPLMTNDSKRLDFDAFKVSAGSEIKAVDKKTGKTLDTVIAKLPIGLDNVFKTVDVNGSYTLASKERFAARQPVDALGMSIGNAMVPVNKAFNTLWKQQINSSKDYANDKEMRSLANMFEINAFAEVPYKEDKKVEGLSVIQPQMQCGINAFANTLAKASNLATHKLEVTDEKGVTRQATLDDIFGKDTVDAVNEILNYNKPTGQDLQAEKTVNGKSKTEIAAEVQSKSIDTLLAAVHEGETPAAEQELAMGE